MKIHLQVGPGHHDSILIEGLVGHGLDFTVSRYFPAYRFDEYMQGKLVADETSLSYNWIKWLIWGVSSKVKRLRSRNSHLDLTYELYDRITANKIQDSNLIFGWAQTSLFTFRKAKQNGISTVLDYPIPHILTWQEQLIIEAEKFSIKRLHSIFSRKMVDRMLEEIELADFVSVPSEFVQNSFLNHGVAMEKLIFNSYGIDTTRFAYHLPSRADSKLKVVFVGSIEIRKGVHYLLEAVSKLDPEKIDVTLVGTVHDDFKSFAVKYSTQKNINWLGQQRKEVVVKEMQQADVMVMPSILEGLSLSCGTPVISTTNAGGLGVIQDGTDGFIVPIRDHEAIALKLDWCIRNREQLRSMRPLASNKIKLHYTQEHYVERFIKKVCNEIKL